MLQPSYTQLMNKLSHEDSESNVTSRYSIIIAVARRARQIIDVVNQEQMSKNPEKAVEETVDPIRIKQAAELNEKLKSKKPTSIAVDELYSGKITIKEHSIEG